MAASRVREVKLRLRVPSELASAAEQIRTTVERELLVRVLEELERLLHARYGARSVIRIRRLAVHWKLDELEITSVEHVARLALDVAEQIIAEIEALPPSERLRPRSPSVALFASERHADAAYLADAVDDTVGEWIHTQPAASETWRAIAAAGPAAVRETVRYLVEMERLVPALALASDDVLAAVEDAVPAAAPDVALIRARRDARIAAPTSGTVTAPAPAPAAHDPAPPLLATPSPPSEVRASRAAPAPAAATPDPAEPIRDAPFAGALAGGESVTAALPGSTDTAAEPEQSGPSVATELAGLFYLVGRVLEIELAERLWAAGLSEGDVLAHIAATIAGTTSDPAWAWFGGAIDRAPVAPPVPAWAAGEVVETVQHALGRRLVRFGVTSSPATLGSELEHLAADMTSPLPLSPTLHRVVAGGTAALCVIVAARLGRPPSLAELRAVARRPGRLVLTADTLHVVMSGSAIDIDHRRAGLDQNVEHAPWLGRRVVFEFAVAGDA